MTRTPINVTFTDERNAAGVEQHACNGCGDCVSGCNVGAKNTLLMNYLPDAVRHGARIFTEVDVRHVARAGTRWSVTIRPLDGGREDFDHAADILVTADIVVVGAGVLGSTEILLRSAARRAPALRRAGHPLLRQRRRARLRVRGPGRRARRRARRPARRGSRVGRARRSPG